MLNQSQLMELRAMHYLTYSLRGGGKILAFSVQPCPDKLLVGFLEIDLFYFKYLNQKPY